MRLCQVLDCGREVAIKSYGLCKTHYMRQYRHSKTTAAIQVKGFIEVNELGAIKCVKCELFQSIDSFDQNLNNSNGKCRHCKDCERQRKLDLIALNPNRHAALKQADHHRRRGVISESITVEELRNEFGDGCVYCGRQMSFSVMKTYNPLRASIEHVVPIARGGLHVRNNVRLACLECNLRKNKKLVEEWSFA